MKRLLFSLFVMVCGLKAYAYTITSQHLSVADGLSSNVVSDMVQDGSGYIWLCTATALNRYDGYRVEQYLQQRHGGAVTIKGMRLKSNKRLLEVTLSNGMATQLDTRTLTTATSGKAKAAGGRTTLIYDNDGVSYERLGKGRVRRVERRGRQLLEREMQLLPEHIITRNLNDHFHVARLKDGNEIITTYGNGFFIYYPQRDRMEHHLSSDPQRLIRNNFITNLLVDSSGCAWLAEDWLGVTCLRFSSVETDRIMLPRSDNPEANNIRAVCPGSNGTVLASNNIGDVFSVNPQTRQAEPLAHYDHRVYAMYRDGDGHLWTGTRGGGLYLDGKLVEGSKGMNIYQIIADRQGTIYLAAMDDGIARVEQGAEGRRVVTRVEALPDVRRIAAGKRGKVVAAPLPHGVMAIETDADGNSWQATQDGLCCTFKGSGGQRRVRTAASALGDVYNENASMLLGDGRMVFGTHDGLVLLTPSSLKHDAASAAPVIVNYTGSGLSLPHDSNTITLQFSTLTFASIADTRYEYRMIGLDTLWREPTAANAVTFQSLQPGDYTFCVRNSAGGKETQLRITIREPWWNTWWAWTIYLLLALAAAGGALLVFLHYSRLRSAYKMEQRMAQFRNDFYRKVLKEIRNPLNVVQGTSEHITHTEAWKSNAQNLRRSSRRLMRIFRSMEEFYSNNLIQSDIERINGEAKAVFDTIKQEIHAEEQTIMEVAPPPANQQQVVIAEADEENSMYLAHLLSPYVKVSSVAGTEAIDEASLAGVSLVVVSVEPGDERAYDFTRHAQRQHGVQVIHLLSEATEQQRLKSLKSGAVACLTKPYNGDMLIATLLNVLRTATRLQTADTPAATILASADDHKWRERLLMVVERHMADCDFSVDMLGELMNLRRTQLNKKVKETTGLTPSQLIRSKRLDRAAQLLRSTNDTTQVVMEKCGFKTTAIFFADFKKQYGMTPAQYRNFNFLK